MYVKLETCFQTDFPFDVSSIYIHIMKMIWELKKLLYESSQLDHLGCQQFQGTLKVACLRNRVQHEVQFQNRSADTIRQYSSSDSRFC